MQYSIHKDKPGPSIRIGDFISLHFVHRTEEDSLLANSYALDHPTFLTQQKVAFKGDIFDGLALLSEGDSATFKLNFDSMQTILNVPKPLHTKSNTLYFTVKIEKVIPRGNLTDSLFDHKIAAFIKLDAGKAMQAENGKIKRYLASKKVALERMRSGLYYQVIRKGAGSLAKKGDSVRFNYTGRLLNTGRVFITCDRNTAEKYGYSPEEAQKYIPTKVPAGMGTLIPGLDEALLFFPKGTIVELIIPSKLGYAAGGQNLGLPPYAPLIFRIEIMG